MPANINSIVTLEQRPVKSCKALKYEVSLQHFLVTVSLIQTLLLCELADEMSVLSDAILPYMQMNVFNLVNVITWD